MLFGEADAAQPFTIVDWQTVGWGPVDDRRLLLPGRRAVGRGPPRAAEEDLVREYHDALHEHGVRGFGWEDCWEEYRRQCFLGLVMTIAPAMIVERTERGDEMFMTLLARYAQQAVDLGALDLLPAPGHRPPRAAAPRARGRGPAPRRSRGAVERELVLRRGHR